MIGEIKLVLLPAVSAMIFASNLVESAPEWVRVVLDAAALAVLFAGFLVLGRLRAQATASEGAATAWREERDAAVSRAERVEEEHRSLLQAARERERELADEVNRLLIEVTRLESRPTLEQVTGQLEQIREIVQKTYATIDQIDGRGAQTTALEGEG